MARDPIRGGRQNLVEDAVEVEHVSATKFPANREINREFFNFGPGSRLRGSQTPNDFVAFEPNSLLNGKGNFLERTGKF